MQLRELQDIQRSEDWLLELLPAPNVCAYIDGECQIIVRGAAALGNLLFICDEGHLRSTRLLWHPHPQEAGLYLEMPMSVLMMLSYSGLTTS